MRAGFFLLSFIFLVSCVAVSQPLKRRAWMNTKAVTVNDSIAKANKLPAVKGILVTEVNPGGTGFLLKLVKNDVILDLNGTATNSPEELKTAINKCREGDVVTVNIIRKGKPKQLKSLAYALPRETSVKCDVLYDRAPFKGGLLSTITLKPKTGGPAPAILFIPGYMCYSLDNLGMHPYGQLVSKLAEQGFVVMRVEKPGEGDCEGTNDCHSIGLNEEVEAFEAGLRKLRTYDFVDQENIFIFGHSLGAMEAPLIAAKNRVKGVIIEGTSADTWFEYILAMFRFQNPLMGTDYVENEQTIQQSIPLLYEYLINKKTPLELAKNPKNNNVLVNLMQYDGSNRIWDRHYSYWQELQDINQAEAWKNTDAHVLVMRGSGDLEAWSTAGHQVIVDMVNKYHPGHGTFVLLENSDHAFCKSNTPLESFQNGQKPGYHYEQFNDNVVMTVAQWMYKVMAK